MRIERNRYLAPLQALASYKTGGAGSATNYANTPNTSYFSQASTMNTWYTALNISGSSGAIYYIIGVLETSATNDSLEIRVTIDGGTATVIENTTGTNLIGGGLSYTANVNNDSDHQLSWLGEVFFEDSVLIEIRQTFGSSPTIKLMCQYGTVV